ncbi:DUF2490 domain-containing protein [Lutibacter maritimus]|jgi:hypothetical protein|uniref:DUF2490 domain-containing protein n=1 Tax=Lutibacter maritimus TaxID=593133 RepID=A0A1I6PEX5_9FLAO|nr:DUF2490 domain-containing protein [Lutibacter maritimus]SFS38752.1 Protein of unknown function [Lutibacter maritimus]
MKFNKTISNTILFFFLVASGITYSQNSDLGNWTAIELEYKFNKKLSFGLEEQLRLKENISQIDEYFTEISTEYDLTKNFSIGAGARFIKENDNEGKIQGNENHFRFQLDAAYKHKIDQFSLKYRFRYQNKNELGISASEGDYANQHIRLKTSIGYNIKKWKLDPEFSAELFNHFKKNEENGFDKFRLSIGTDYDLKKYGKINLYYQFEKELNTSNPSILNVIGLKYKYTFKNK